MIKDTLSPKVARDVTRRTNRGRRALIVNSPKNDGTEVSLESGLEKNVALLLDLDPRVISYYAQPFVLELTSESFLDKKEDFKDKFDIKPMFYTTDVLAELGNHEKTVIESKASRFEDEFAKKRKVIESILQRKGIQFLLVKDDDLNANLIANISCIHSFRAGYLEMFRATNALELDRLLSVQQEWRVTELANQHSAGMAAVITGLLSGQLSANLWESLFTEEASVHAAFGDLSHFQILGLS